MLNDLTPDCGWERSLAYTMSQVALVMMAELDKQLYRDLGIGCRHLGLLNWIEQGGGSLVYPLDLNPGIASEMPRETIGVMRLFQLIFWGSTDPEQRTPELAQQLAHLQERGLVTQKGDSHYPGQRRIYLTQAGRKLRKEAWDRIASIEEGFLEMPNFELFSLDLA